MSHPFNARKIETVITDGKEDIPEELEEENRSSRTSRRSKRSNLIIIVAVVVAAVVIALIVIYLISRRRNKEKSSKDASEAEAGDDSPKNGRSYTDEQVEKFSQRARQRISEYKDELEKKNNQIDELQRQIESIGTKTKTMPAEDTPEDVAEGITVRRSKKPEKKPSRPMNIPLKEVDDGDASDSESDAHTSAPAKPEIEEVAAILADEGHLESKSDD